MAKVLYEIIYRKPQGAPALTSQMLAWLENFGSTSGSFTLDLTSLQSWLLEQASQESLADPALSPLIQWLEGYLKAGIYHDFVVLEE